MEDRWFEMIKKGKFICERELKLLCEKVISNIIYLITFTLLNHT